MSLNRSQDGKDRNETDTRREDVELEVCEIGDWADGVVVAIVGCPFERDAPKGAVDFFLRRSDIDELNEGQVLKGVVYRDGGTLCEAEKRDELGNPNSRAGAGRVEPGNDDEKILWGFGSAKEERCEDALKEKMKGS